MCGRPRGPPHQGAPCRRVAEGNPVSSGPWGDRIIKQIPSVLLVEASTHVTPSHPIQVWEEERGLGQTLFSLITGPGDVPKLPEPLWPHLQNGNPAVPGAGVGVRSLKDPPAPAQPGSAQRGCGLGLPGKLAGEPARPWGDGDDTDSRVPHEGLYCPQLWQPAGTSASHRHSWTPAPTGSPGTRPGRG